ncbi:hypothetical protein LARV_02697 [Longilinea arvoryzae]|uniref:Uncharacterized protein n=1 Tax=Longilinea arvoryzae TaxID=360412 RepID=A0A0S7BK89_9CHLR|nr:hypothetical protein LARV_02697 [Longilinea arvoryzae]
MGTTPITHPRTPDESRGFLSVNVDYTLDLWVKILFLLLTLSRTAIY